MVFVCLCVCACPARDTAMGENSPVAKYLAEFVGTFMLILTVGCNVLT